MNTCNTKQIALLLLLGSVLTGCSDPATNTATESASTASATAAADLAPLDAPADFRGTWILNTDRGENLGMMKAVKQTVVASQSEEGIVFSMANTFAGMDSSREISYDLGGKTSENNAAMGAASKTVSSWDGAKLVTIWTEEGAIAGTETERVETRWLSEDGKALSVSMVRGDNDPMVFVYEKSE